MAHTFLSSRQISVSDDIFIVLQGSRNDNVIERPMFCPDSTFRGFLPDFCLYRYKIKLYIHHFLSLMAVVCPSLTPSVDSGINRIQRWSQSKPQYIGFSEFSCHIYGVPVPNWSASSVIRNKHPPATALDTRQSFSAQPGSVMKISGIRYKHPRLISFQARSNNE